MRDVWRWFAFGTGGVECKEPQSALGFYDFFGGCLVEVLAGTLAILYDAVATPVELSDPIVGAMLVFADGSGEPSKSVGVLAAESGDISEAEHGAWMALAGGLFVPARGFLLICFDSNAVQVKPAHR
jgi:hypothetical protein